MSKTFEYSLLIAFNSLLPRLRVKFHHLFPVFLADYNKHYVQKEPLTMVVYRLLAVVSCLILGLASAQDYNFIVAYEEPADDVQAEYKLSLEQGQFLENLIKDFDNISLPEDIGVVGAPCGDANAYWDPTARAMIVCYELLDLMGQMFRADATSQEELDNEVFGATRFIFYHELGHALIDIFGIPFTGREEDAVDQFSTILLLGGGSVDAALAGANFFYKFASVTELDQLVFWDEHSLDQQRFYDIVCLVYGSDPETYDFLLQRDTKGFLLSNDQGYLPKERAERCYDEYKAISGSWKQLIESFVPHTEGTEVAISTGPTPTLAVADVLETTDYNETFTGTLQDGDDTLDNGEYFDYYDVELVQGQEVTFELSSTEFDTYLIISAPDDFGYVNDDATIKVDGYLSKLTIPISTTGTWTIGVSSYEAGQSGNYQVGVVKYDGIYNEVFTESLADGDTSYETGEFVDSYDYSFEAGQSATIVLSSLDFDPYLVVTTPSGETIVNDDFENQFGMARVDFDATQSGTYTISATSYAKEEKGAYQIAISSVGAVSPETTVNADTGSLFTDYQQGTLSSGDRAYESGELYDAYSYDFSQGQVFIVDAFSSEFNTYLVALSPSGEQVYNDDYATDGSSTDAGLDLEVTESGTWTVYVTSSKTDETGAYDFYISEFDPNAQPATTDTTDTTDVQASTQDISITDMTSTKARASNIGVLGTGDSTLDDGSYVDYYSVDLTAGQEAVFSLVSADFNTYLGVMNPSGELLELDEQEDTSRSRITLNVEETGVWYVIVTSINVGEEGNYLLSIKK
jgi:Putative metallopeptidase